jgi:hypothetical protein
MLSCYWRKLKTILLDNTSPLCALIDAIWRFINRGVAERRRTSCRVPDYPPKGKVDELALDVHIDEEHSMIILDVKSDGLFSGLQVVFGLDAMLDLCRRGLGAVMKLKRQTAGTSGLALDLERPPMTCRF